ncbi:hypothetical protein MUK42_15923 [Musa troglodytarum]|uniref:Uncharacterized protein n=1 Tax=Musa troglodytarum TaxID=320322 RepID=A0A9E7K277_9LILI|nr:hypothetical protein MUK42_15923 [Musa troglodytarum]
MMCNVETWKQSHAFGHFCILFDQQNILFFDFHLIKMFF